VIGSRYLATFGYCGSTLDQLKLRVSGGTREIILIAFTCIVVYRDAVSELTSIFRRRPTYKRVQYFVLPNFGGNASLLNISTNAVKTLDYQFNGHLIPVPTMKPLKN
jgi:hypothetical protein